MSPSKQESAATSAAASSAANRHELQLDQSPSKELPDEEKTVEQLVREAQKTHKDTTATAQRALRTVEDSKQVKNNMLSELEAQSRKMEKIDDRMHRLNEDLSYSEKILSYMRRCCCLWICDSCTGADPEARMERDWREKTRRGEFNVERYKAIHGGNADKTPGIFDKKNGAGKNHDGPQFRELDTTLPEGHEKAGMRLAEETRKQDDIINKIHNGLDDLLDGAKTCTMSDVSDFPLILLVSVSWRKMIQDEIGRQDKLVEHLDSKAAKTNDRIENMNGKSQLRKYARAASSRQDSDPIGAELANAKVDAIKLLYK
ncbi:hypothetical protein CEUSTIGMA_g6327.t1 [Chlamydomonas eustigma]|uniref:t-SNARE coiled-coil homology domain-containing protein n=1 Tax=Chlamydomonas eustigma TaxID=1157962 RepID=A0A250X728_9CHLO|nr:hypothetical protein CEUSTIGMA_g6327.t1 [Chlamydomonas eustigma]|eukprot:GAX78888.1 hypothetical protein CEUSTIGMA_g6327.t1 [Chlamydomonas eustigma]